MFKVERAVTNITQAVNKIQSVSDSIRENCMNQQVNQQLCAEYRKLVDDVREIKGHLDSLVYNRGSQTF